MAMQAFALSFPMIGRAAPVADEFTKVLLSPPVSWSPKAGSNLEQVTR